MLTQQTLKQYLDYNPTTGLFHYKESRGNVTEGTVAGNVHHKGYIRIGINSKQYLAHRLVWLYLYNKVPLGIDHINNIKSDNRLCNLRECNNQQNRRNTKNVNPRSQTGIRGVIKKDRNQKYNAVIYLDGNRKNLGSYKTLEEAKAVREKAEKLYFGEFAPERT